MALHLKKMVSTEFSKTDTKMQMAKEY